MNSRRDPSSSSQSAVASWCPCCGTDDANHRLWRGLTTADRQFEDRVWRHRIETAFAPYECPEVPEVVLPAGSYPGKLIDTHFHMPHIPDSRPGAEPGENELGGYGEERFYDWMSEPEESDPIRVQQPLAGKNITITELACLLRTDGTDGAFAFSPVCPHILDQLLDLV